MEPRHASLLVGKKSYRILTSLDEPSLREVYEVLRDAVADTDPAMEQDERLFLAAITLANELITISDSVGRMTSMIEERNGPWRTRTDRSETTKSMDIGGEEGLNAS